MGSLLVILLSVGILWLRSSFGKFSSGTFVSNLGATLAKTAEKNPYPWFKEFLTSVAVPNAQLFGYLVLWGELLSAIAITAGAILMLINPHPARTVVLLFILGLVGGLLLNVIFWLGFGYSNPSTETVNLLMAVVQIVGIVVLLKNL